jgi:sulfite exporter TauE/SafE
MTAALAAKALLLGLSTGLYCAGFCLPLVGPLLLADEKAGMRRSAARVGLFLAGRLVAYLIFGLVFGALGGRLGRVWAAKTVLLPMVYAALGLLMVVYGLVQSFPHLGFCRIVNPRVTSGWYVAALGFLAGINLCPPFLLAVTAVVDTGGALRGALFFVVFFLATSVYLLPLFFSGLVSRFGSVRFAGRAAAILAGLYFTSLAVRTLLAR